MKCGEGCQGKVSVADRFCASCGKQNENYNEKEASLREGKRSGWKKAPDWLSVVPETDKEKELAQGVGELFKKLRSNKGQANAAAGSDGAAPGDVAPATSSAQASAEKPDEQGEEDKAEYDLNDPEGCVAYMLACFPDKELQDAQKTVQDTARFFVTSELRKRTGKGNPLYHVFQKAIIKTNQLATKSMAYRVPFCEASAKGEEAVTATRGRNSMGRLALHCL